MKDYKDKGVMRRAEQRGSNSATVKRPHWRTLQARSRTEQAFHPFPMDSVGTRRVYRPGAQHRNIGRHPKNYTPNKFHAMKVRIKELEAQGFLALIA